MNSNAPPKSRAREWLGALTLSGYAAIILVATLWPTPLDQGYQASIDKLLAVLYRNGVPLWFGYNKLEFSANVLMFIPLGFLVALLLPGRIWWLALILCPAMSIAIELTQAFALSARFATVTDVISNSLGAVIGIMIAVMLRAIVYERDQKVIALAAWRAQYIR
ncbi:VanZ family protein [Cryobacterium sp. N22]|uniref:VanZ family protein n=1 Tax=Cryobacterium sp. N22 TaxID=2048290 RepID=UPI000CE50FA9|nr:VanZ family protein [Cryobacterium sp. N22]